MIIAKVLRIQGDNVLQIEEFASSLQDFINKVSIADMKKLLDKFKENPSIIKTALKLV